MNIGGVPQNKAVAQNSGCLTIFGIPFAAVGMWVGISTLWTLAGPYNIDREQVAMRLVMSVLFAGCGFGLIAWGRYSTKEVAKARETVGRSPDKPWLWREDWAQGYCAPEWRENARIMSIIGVAFLLFTLPMALQLPKELERGRYVVLIALVFPLTGTCLLVTSLTGYLRGQKFRGLKFVPAASPVPLGGRLKGKIQMTKELPQTTANLTLNCIRSYRSGSGSDSSHWETVQWQSRITVPVSFDGRDSFIPIDIPIPFDAQETDMRNPDNSIFWRLTASSKMPGLDFRATFLMPIFKTASSDSSVTIQSLDAKDEARLAGQQPREAQIDFKTLPDGTVRFYFAPARNKKIASALTIFAAIFTAAGLFFGIGFGSHLSWFIGAIPLLFSCGFGLLMFAIAFWLWFGSTTVEVVHGDLHVRSGCFGLSRSRMIHPSDIRDIELYSGMQQGTDVWYDLKLRLANGLKVTAGSGMRKEEAEWYREELRKDLRISPDNP